MIESLATLALNHSAVVVHYAVQQALTLFKRKVSRLWTDKTSGNEFAEHAMTLKTKRAEYWGYPGEPSSTYRATSIIHVYIRLVAH